jgi:DNA repair protein RecN (Recombination protein N)
MKTPWETKFFLPIARISVQIGRGLPAMLAMLTTLRIKNLALVADLTIEWQPGCNVITGETGAGKSILIGALNLILGGRADRALIRSGSESCSVEAVFDVRRLRAPLPAFLEANGLEPCDEGQLTLKRIFSIAGANRQFVNGSPTSLHTLAAIGEWLVDIHGPHEHQSLLQPAKQLAILDAFGGLQAEREAFGELARRRASVVAAKAALIVDEQTYARQLDLLRFQTEEIDAARVQPGEDQQLDEDHRRASNAARLLQLGQSALDTLAENDASLLTQAGIVGRALQELQRLDPGAAPLVSQHEQATAAWRELQADLSRYLDRVDVDPERLRELEERLNLIQSLKRKYGATLADVIAFGAQARETLRGLEQRDAELARLESDLARLDGELARAGTELSEKRRAAIPRLAKAAARQLSDLGFRQSRLDVELASASPIGKSGAEIPLAGFDTVEFQFAPNPGEPARPLRTIASSGELARVMLALKTVLAAEDEIPVLIFDEVDANVGGETANVVGEKMRQIARQRQVLCITHLPQVAASAGAHYTVTKQVSGGRTTSEIRLLEREERVTELARMLGGQTDAARRHAEAMLA